MPFRAITNQHLALSGTKEDKGSTMMLAMWLLLMKRHVSGQRSASSSEEIKSIAFSLSYAWLKASIIQ